MPIDDESWCIMAGKWLLEQMYQRGGKASDYADVVYGKVIATKPLKVQIANNMVIDENFIVVGKHIGHFKLKGKAKVKGTEQASYHGHNGTADISSGQITITEIIIDNSLKKGDKVTMIRSDGGQKFYLFERVGEDGFGF